VKPRMDDCLHFFFFLIWIAALIYSIALSSSFLLPITLMVVWPLRPSFTPMCLFCPFPKPGFALLEDLD
jgi:hypothetical protein